MSITVTEYTRRKASRANCCACSLPIEPGERYRELIAVGETDIWDTSFHRSQAHASCVSGEEWWELRPRERAAPRPDPQVVVDAFNEQHPLGTWVKYWPFVRGDECHDGRTRTTARVLGGHTPVVWVEGYRSCIALTHVEAR